MEAAASWTSSFLCFFYFPVFLTIAHGIHTHTEVEAGTERSKCRLLQIAKRKWKRPGWSRYDKMTCTSCGRTVMPAWITRWLVDISSNPSTPDVWSGGFQWGWRKFAFFSCPIPSQVVLQGMANHFANRNRPNAVRFLYLDPFVTIMALIPINYFRSLSAVLPLS